MGYQEDEAICFIKVTKHDNISFNCKVVENEDGEKDVKEAVINLEEEANKKSIQWKAKKDVVQVLLLVAMSRLSTPASTFVFISRSSTVMPGLSTVIFGLSTVMPKLTTIMLRFSVAKLRLFTTMLGFYIAVSRLFISRSTSVFVLWPSTLVLLFASISASITVPRLSTLISISLFMLVPRMFSLSAFPRTLVFRSSP